MRLIDAGALIAEMHNVVLENGEDRQIFYKVIEQQPTIDISPVKHGHWIDDCTCSICNWIHEDAKGFALLTTYPYCPNCGTKMDEIYK